MYKHIVEPAILFLSLVNNTQSNFWKQKKDTLLFTVQHVSDIRDPDVLDIAEMLFLDPSQQSSLIVPFTLCTLRLLFSTVSQNSYICWMRKPRLDSVLALCGWFICIILWKTSWPFMWFVLVCKAGVQGHSLYISVCVMLQFTYQCV